MNRGKGMVLGYMSRGGAGKGDGVAKGGSESE